MVYEYDHFTEAERRGKLIKDTHPDEHATCYILQGRGLIVISSCGHVGLINTIKQAMAVRRLEAPCGAWRISSFYRAARLHRSHGRRTGGVLKPDVVIPMHCSGAAFIETMRRRMPAQSG